jgi:glycosyltransferase involved in cell wall biosynthesis
MAHPSLSIIVPCRNERHYIAQCLDSILTQDYPRERIVQVLVIDGHSDDGTRAIIADYVARVPVVRLLDNPRRIPAAALNVGIGEASGEVLVRLDVHATYPPTYLSKLVAAQEAHAADNVGGVIVTLPADRSATARAIAVALSHPFGVGDSYFRIGTGDPRWVDTVAFFCCRREVFERVGGFDEELARAEDCEFNFRLRRQGGRVLLVPGVEARYYARRTLGQLARMLYQYGYFKAVVTRKLGHLLSVRQLVPAAFVVALTVSAVVSVWVPVARLPLMLILGAYGAALLVSAIGASGRLGVRGTLVLPAAFAVMHFSYGVGFLKGITGWFGARVQGVSEGAVRLSR